MSADQKVCPDCAEEVKAAARICRFCGFKFDNANAASVSDIPESISHDGQSEEITGPSEPSGDKKPGYLIVAICVGILFFVVYSVATTDTTSGVTDPTLESAELAAASAVAADAEGASDPKSANGWIYETSKDEVRNADIKTATLTSDNTVFLSAPYGGGTKAELIVRKHPEHGIDVVLRASPSQIICDNFDGCTININIDGKPQKLSMVTPADFDSEYFFVRNARSFLAKLKSAKKVVVEIPFYSNGNGQFQFNTAGLEWAD